MRIHGRRRLLTLAFVFGLVTVACSEDGGQGTTTPTPGDTTGSAPEQASVTVLIDFFANGNHTVFYTAQGEGFFDEEQLDVEIRHILGGAEVIRSLASGQAEFGYADFASMAIANQEQGAGLTAIMGLLQQTPMGIIAPTSRGLTEPSDLVGKSLVQFPGSSTAIVWPVFLSENGLDDADVNDEFVDPGSILPLVIQGQADGAIAFFTDNEPRLRKLCDCDVSSIKWKDWGIQALSNGLMASNDYLAENADVATRFVSAMVKALEFLRANPEQGIDHLIEAVGIEELGVEKDVLLAQVQNWLTITTSTAGGGTPTGFMTDADWESTVDLMVRAEQMGAPDAISAFYTNEYLPSDE